MTRHASLLSTLALVIAACSTKKKDEAPAAGPPAVAAKTEPAAAPAPALTDIDLGKAGRAWSGFHVKGLAPAEIADDGTGGMIITFSDHTGLQLSPAENRDVKQFKQALARNFKTVTYAVDTPEDLEYTTVSDMGGNLITGYGLSIVVTAGGKKVECAATVDDEATVHRMKDVCTSLAK
jgi:hypothetical protein